MFRELCAPISVNWEVTANCNLNCVHCYNYWRQDPIGEKPSRVSRLSLFEQTCEQIITNDVFSVTITGGEPLLVFSDALPFMLALMENNIHVTINSNLSLLTEETADKIAVLGIPLLTSLSSANAEANNKITNSVDSSSLIVNGIKKAIARGIPISVNMVVSRVNIDDIYDTAALVHSLGVRSFSATPACKPLSCEDFTDYALEQSDLPRLTSQLLDAESHFGLRVDTLLPYPLCSHPLSSGSFSLTNGRSCSAGKTNCTIGYDGGIRACLHSEKTYGHINDGIRAAWNLMTEWRNDSLLPVVCAPCKLKDKCAGGCRLSAYSNYGSMSAIDPMFVEPITNLDTTAAFSESSSTSSNQKIGNNRYIFRKSLKLRKEEFGGILYAEGKSIPVSHNLFRFINNNTKASASFAIDDISNALGVDANEVTSTINVLFSSNAIAAYPS